MPQISRPKRRRFNGRFPEPLLEEVEAYAREKNKSVTQVIIDQLTILMGKERPRASR